MQPRPLCNTTKTSRTRGVGYHNTGHDQCLRPSSLSPPSLSLSQSNTDSSLIDVAAAYLAPLSRTNSVRRSYLASQLMATHIGANGVRPPGKNGRKIKKGKHAKKCSFLNGWCGENGAILTTYLFRYTSECTVS